MGGYLYVDNANPTLSHSTTFTYDGVKRLATAAATQFGSGTVSYSDTYNYDRYGNMSWLPGGSGPVLTYLASSNHINQIGSLYAGYDSAGNLTSDGTHTYQWDGEDRLASVDGGSTETQVYDALGQQVQVNWAGGAWNVLFDPSGRWMGRNTAGNWNVSGVFHLDGRQFGIYLDQFYGIHENTLGSSDSTTNAAGSETGQSLFYPWGQVWSLGSAAWNFSAFEYGSPPPILPPTLFRTYDPNLGRWMSPDPMGGDVTNPQSLNRYAYVLNNPTTLIDPLGLDGCDQSDDPEHCRALCWSEGDDYPNCPNETGGGGGYPVGGRGSSGGGGGAPAPPSVPPAGQPPLPGSEGFVGLPPCIDYNALIPVIAALINKELHPVTPVTVSYLDTQGGAPEFSINGGGQTSLWQPLQGSSAKGDIFHQAHGRTLADQAVYPEPKDIVPGAGSVLHVLYNPVVTTTGGAVKIQDLRAHFDILSPRNPLHFGTDVVFARIVSAIEGCGQGGIKFQ